MADDYFLGSKESEFERLVLQGKFYDPSTAELLTLFGFGSKRRVLDVGCGVGQVSRLVASIDGFAGKVLGIDMNSKTLDQARKTTNCDDKVQFETHDLQTSLPEGVFNAVIGRLVLMYVPEPGLVLQRLAGKLSDGGTMLFQEADHSDYMTTEPYSELFAHWRSCILLSAERSDVTLNFGRKLPNLLRNAFGVEPTVVTHLHRYGKPCLDLCRLFALTAESAQTAMTTFGVLEQGESVPPDLADQLYSEWCENELTVSASTLIGAGVTLT